MILALAGNGPSTTGQAASFLEARSVAVRSIEEITDLSDLDDRKHLVLTHVSSIEALGPLRGRRDFRLVFLGELPDGAGPLAELATAADARIGALDEEGQAVLVRLATEAMCSYQRPGWDQYFMEIAEVVGRRSNCMKRQVAAVVVKDQRIVATGYNGTPRGAKNCNEGGCPRCNSLAPTGTDLDECLCNHAEENAVAQAAFHGITLKDATIYCTYSPCMRCSKLLINAGIAEVVYDARYSMEETPLALLADCGVEIRRYTGS